MWWQDVLWGFWNGLTAWIVLIVHVFGGWRGYAFYDVARRGNWYDLGFLVGAGSPVLGAFGPTRRWAPRAGAPAQPRHDGPAPGGGAV